MPDYFGVYPDLQVWEYLDFFAACYKIAESRRLALISELLELVDLQHRRDDLVDRLSRGMKQRLSLARTLIHDPQVLVLDEPASGLDPRARIEIRALLVELAKMGKTIFFSTHILADVAEICTRIGILEGGRLVASGGLEELHLSILPQRKIEVTLLDPPQAAQAYLEAQENGSNVELLHASRAAPGSAWLLNLAATTMPQPGTDRIVVGRGARAALQRGQQEHGRGLSAGDRGTGDMKLHFAPWKNPVLVKEVRTRHARQPQFHGSHSIPGGVRDLHRVGLHSSRSRSVPAARQTSAAWWASSFRPGGLDRIGNR